MLPTPSITKQKQPAKKVTKKNKLSKKMSLLDWQALIDDEAVEFIDGQLVYKALPTFDHGFVQAMLSSYLMDSYNRRVGEQDKPGGWWIAHEVDIKLGAHGLRPDSAGWKREKHIQKPKPKSGAKVITEAPDWVCEILSESTAARNLGAKRKIYHQFGVSHYWLIDPHHHTLTVLVWKEEDYLIAQVAGPLDIICAGPFTQVEISISRLLGLEEEPSTEV